MALKNHSVIENTHGEMSRVSDAELLTICIGLERIIAYEKPRVERRLLKTNPMIAELLDVEPESLPPEFDN